MIPSELPAGTIFHVVAAAGLELKGAGDKRTLRCPLHNDRTASAFVSASRNLFSCSSGCGSYSAKRFAEALGVSWPPSSLRGRGDSVFPSARRLSPAPKADEPPTFGAEAAEAVWRACLERVREDKAATIAADADVYGFLRRRGLSQALTEEDALGILPPALTVEGLERWHERGYRLVAPLFDAAGRLANIQARAIGDSQLKTLNPRGSRAAGLAFASRLGRELLRGEWNGDTVILAEGLTDTLGLAMVAEVPVLAAPGVGPASRAVGTWCRGRRVILAMDQDEAGERVVGDIARAVKAAGGVPLRLRWPPGAKDACETLERLGVEGLGDSLAEAVRGTK